MVAAGSIDRRDGDRLESRWPRILINFAKERLVARSLSISEVKARLSELVAGVMEREEEVVVTRNGRPAAVLVNVDEYERLKETLDVLGDADLMRQVRDSERYFGKGGKGLSFHQVFDEPLRRAGKRAWPRCQLV